MSRSISGLSNSQRRTARTLAIEPRPRAQNLSHHLSPRNRITMSGDDRVKGPRVLVPLDQLKFSRASLGIGIGFLGTSDDEERFTDEPFTLPVDVGFGNRPALERLPQQVPLPLEKLLPVIIAVKSDRAKFGRHSLVEVRPNILATARPRRRDKALLRVIDLPVNFPMPPSPLIWRARRSSSSAACRLRASWGNCAAFDRRQLAVLSAW